MINLIQKSSMKDVLFHTTESKTYNSLRFPIILDYFDGKNLYKSFSLPHVFIEHKLKNRYQGFLLKKKYTH